MTTSTNILKRFGHNLTNLAQQGKFAPLAGQDAVAERAFQVLLRQNKCNPLLIDPDPAWRIAVLQEIVRCIAIEEAPETLVQKQIIALDKKALFAKPFDDLDEYWQHLEEHYRYQRQRLAPHSQQPPSYWQNFLNQEPLSPEAEQYFAPIIAYERFRAICQRLVIATGAFILFIDDFHTFVGADNFDTFNILVPMLARRQIQLIGACNIEEYRRYIERDAGLQFRFQEIVLPH